MISIIIPIYNAEKYLLECFASIQNQTYKKFEVICVNDGSNDKSGEFCKMIVEEDTRFKYVEQANGGVSKARNKGLEISKGDFVIFVDADDVLPRYALEMYMKFEKENDTVAGYTHIWDGNRINYTDKDFKKHDGINYLLNEYLYSNTKYQFCSFLYRKKILNEYSIKFSEDLKYGEDEEFAWKYLNHCKTAATLTLNMYYYRENACSASHTISYDRVQVIETMIRVSSYYHINNHPFYSKIFHFGIPRAKLSILKQFAINGRKDLFEQLGRSKKYYYKLFPLLLFPDVRIKIASLAYTLSSNLFYNLLNKKR